MKVTHTLLYVTQVDLRKCRKVQISQYGLDLELKQARRTGEKDLADTVGTDGTFQLSTGKAK